MARFLDPIAAQFHGAFHSKEWSGEFNAAVSALTVSEAYEVQDLIAGLRTKAGESVAGYKVGCTSMAIRSQFGLSEPICGRLFHPHLFEEGARLDWSEYANCAIEPEMVLKTGADLRGEDLSDSELIDAIDYVSPGIEIHHFRFWLGRPTLQELICSGGIHAGLVVGRTRMSPRDLRFRDELFSVYIGDTLVTSAPASEIMGGPLHSLRWLVNHLTAKGDGLKKGSLVIPGSPTQLVEINRDTELTIEIDRVGRAKACFYAN